MTVQGTVAGCGALQAWRRLYGHRSAPTALRAHREPRSPDSASHARTGPPGRVTRHTPA